MCLFLFSLHARLEKFQGIDTIGILSTRVDKRPEVSIQFSIEVACVEGVSVCGCATHAQIEDLPQGNLQPQCVVTIPSTPHARPTSNILLSNWARLASSCCVTGVRMSEYSNKEKFECQYLRLKLSTIGACACCYSPFTRDLRSFRVSTP